MNPFSDKNGAIVGYSIVVTTDKDLKDLAMADLPNWSHRQTGDAVLYVAVEKCPNFFTAGNTCWSSGVMKRSVSVDQVVVTVGGDPKCDENDRDPCNGKLTPGTTYYTMLRAYTEGNLFANTPFSQGVTTGRLRTHTGQRAISTLASSAIYITECTGKTWLFSCHIRPRMH